MQSENIKYKSTNISAMLVTILLGICFCLNLSILIILIRELHLITNQISTSSLFSNNDIVSTAKVLDAYLHLFYVTGTICSLAFLTWVYQINKYLSFVRKSPLEFTPIIAVASFVIPIVCIYWPFKVLNEIWQHSKTKNCNYKKYPRSSVVLLFWISFFIAKYGSFILSKVELWNKLPSIHIFLIELTCIQILYGLVSISGIIIVRTIHKRLSLR